MSSSNQSLYHQLLKRSKSGSSEDSSSKGGRYGFGGSKGGGGRRFHGTTKKKKSQGQDRERSRDREHAEPVIREGRVLRADDTDRDLAYRPPAPRQDQAITWRPPTFADIMVDLGLRIVEVGIASMAQEIAYFFTRRRFMPKYLRQG